MPNETERDNTFGRDPRDPRETQLEADQRLRAQTLNTDQSGNRVEPHPDQRASASDQAAVRRKQFEIEQKARAEAFERENTAAERKLARDEEDQRAITEEQARVAKIVQENDDAALADGFITHDDLLQRKELLSSNHGAMLPHEAIAEGEATIKMAFPRTVILTHSAADVRRLQGLVDNNQDNNYNRSDDRPINRLGDEGSVGAVSPIAPIVSAIAGGSRVLFWRGYHDVAASLADHGWLTANGAYPVDDSNEKSRAPITDAALKPVPVRDGVG